MEETMWNRGMVVVGIMLVAAVFAGALGSCRAEEPKQIPRSVIFGNPEKALPEISPDGKMLAYAAPLGGVLNVWVKTIGHEDDRAVTKDTNRGIFRYFWSGDGKRIMYLQDKGGNENWQLYDVDLATGETRSLTPYENVAVEIIGQDKHFPTHLIVGMNKENPSLHDVYHLDLTTAELKLVAKNPGNVAGWLTDNYLQVKLAMAPTAQGGMDLLYRAPGDTVWTPILTWDSDNSLTSSPVGFAKDGKTVYMVDSRNANAARLVKMDLGTGKTQVVTSDSLYDVADIVINPDTYEVEAVGFTKDRSEWVVLDPALKKDFDAIRRIQPGDFNIASRDDADKTWVVGFTRDDGPYAYYAYDRVTGKATLLFYTRPELLKYTLAPMEPVVFQARDGLTVHGYATYPPGKPRKNLPMVLNVHGGPWVRDTWGYNPEAQWLANRGYVCLQVNYRGSTGYGKAFLNAGDREWGGKMHDDLIDAVNMMVTAGTVDPKRIAIFGGSYGGYAALVGATFTPDVFSCAVAEMGPSNLITFIETVPPYWSSMLTILYKRIGNPQTDAEFLKSRSPLFKVDQIKIPMMIAHGANDPRVKQAESDQIVQVMKDKGLYVEYMVFPDEGHGFAKPENRLKFYAAAEKFLGQRLGGRYQE
jgi:dipeptidyl aminopeptidase/acylaminoacyl peptidase